MPAALPYKLQDKDQDCVLVPSLPGSLLSGDFIKMRDVVRPYPSMPLTDVGQFLRIKPSGMLYVRLLVSVSDVWVVPPFVPLVPPIGRGYIEYPDEVMYVNKAISIPVQQVDDVVHVFQPEDLHCTHASHCVGMYNAVVLRKAIYCETKKVVDSPVLRPQHLHSTYGYRIYGVIIRVVKGVNEAMRKTSSVAANRHTVHVGCLPDEWQYMITRLEGGVLSVRKLGVRMLDLKREHGNRERVRVPNEMALYRIDSVAALADFKLLCGSYVDYAHREKPAKFRSKKKPKLGQHVHQQVQQNANHPLSTLLLPTVSPTDANDYPHLFTKNRGLDLLYDPVLQMLHITARFDELSVEEKFGGDDDDDDSDDGTAAATVLSARVGSVFTVEKENDVAMYQAVNFNSNGTVSCRILESTNAEEKDDVVQLPRNEYETYYSQSLAT